MVLFPFSLDIPMNNYKDKYALFSLLQVSLYGISTTSTFEQFKNRIFGDSDGVPFLLYNRNDKLEFKILEPLTYCVIDHYCFNKSTSSLVSLLIKECLEKYKS